MSKGAPSGFDDALRGIEEGAVEVEEDVSQGNLRKERPMEAGWYGEVEYAAEMIIETIAAAGWALGVPTGAGLMKFDLSAEETRRVVVDRQEGQYLGHVSTVLLEDGKTILAVYPKGHGKGEIVLKRSTDSGVSWSERLPTPSSWKESKECPSIHRMIGSDGKKRLVLWSGLYPARCWVSEDDGATWTEISPSGTGTPWGGIVVMSAAEAGKEPGAYHAWFHDDGRFFAAGGRVSPAFTLYQVDTRDGGLTWDPPRAIFASKEVSLCEPGTVRSADGTVIAMLLREESRRKRSHVMVSRDEGQTWDAPVELPLTLTGDKHTARQMPDGRLVISFREHTVKGIITGDQEASSVPGASEWEGDWVLWVGTFEDVLHGREGQYKVRLMDNHKAWDCAYPGVEVLNDGTIVATTYGHWERDKAPFIVSVRLTLGELDALAARR